MAQACFVTKLDEFLMGSSVIMIELSSDVIPCLITADNGGHPVFSDKS